MPMNEKANIADLIIENLPELEPVQRFVVAIAGPPASGKSTLTEELLAKLGSKGGALGLDAYHLDDTILEARGEGHRKGAVHTFDPIAYKNTLVALKTNPSETVTVPVFDRSIEISRNCAHVIEPQQTVLVTEGNYLLLEQDPWLDLKQHFDLTVKLSPSFEVIEQRLHQRWVDHGYPPAEIEAKVNDNDLPNAKFVVENSGPADLEFD